MILKVIFESNCSLEGFLEILGSEERPKTCSQTCFKTLDFPLEMAPQIYNMLLNKNTKNLKQIDFRSSPDPLRSPGNKNIPSRRCIGSRPVLPRLRIKVSGSLSYLLLKIQSSFLIIFYILLFFLYMYIYMPKKNTSI